MRPASQRLLTEANAGAHAANRTTPLGAAIIAAVADRTGTVNLLDYAATPIGVGDATNDTAALLAGIEGARIAKRNLAIPAMKLLINAEITLPNITANVRKVGLIGAGTALTELQWSVDLGPGKFGIRTASGNADVGECFITGMTLTGPSRTRVLEVSPCQMMGIEASRKMHFIDIVTNYFKAGWLLNGDHISFVRCYVPNNYYGIYFANATIDGDISLFECDLTGATMATFAVGIGGRLSALSMYRGHMGFAPYGIFIEPGVAPTISETVVFGASFYGTSWEAFGAAACYDSDGIGYWRNMKFIDAANFSMLSNLAGNDYATPSRGRPALFKLGTMAGWSFQGLTLSNSTVRPDAMFAVGGYGILDSEISGARDSAFGDYLTAGKKIIAAGGGGSRTNLRYNGYGEYGIFRRLSDQGAVAAGDLMTLRTNDQCQPNDSTGRLVGVAAYAEATLGAGVLIIESAEQATVAFATAAPIMSAIVVSPANPRKAAPRSEAPTAPVIGMLTTGAAAANGTATTFFRAQAG